MKKKKMCLVILIISMLCAGCSLKSKKEESAIITGTLPEKAEEAIREYESKKEESKNAETSAKEEITPEDTKEDKQKLYIITDVDDGYEEGQMYGQLDIEDVEVHVTLYWTNVAGDGKSAQEIVDAEYSAAYFRYGAEYVIADHDYQGFDSIKNVKAEETKAKITLTDGSEKTYTCVRTCLGTKDKNMYDEDGTEISLLNEGGIATYTCQDETATVFIAFWQPEE